MPRMLLRDPHWQHQLGQHIGWSAMRAAWRRHMNRLCLCLCGLGIVTAGWSLPELVHASGGAAGDQVSVTFPPALASYEDAGMKIVDRLAHRIQHNPFNIAATLIFFLAIVHTFMSSRFLTISDKLQAHHKVRISQGNAPLRSVSHSGRFLHFMGEVEVIFGLWAIALVLAILAFFDWPTAVHYLSDTVDFTEPMFVMVIMTLAATRPILKLSESIMNRVAAAFGGTLTAWWLTILTLGPLLGSFITEPAAMTISALLLSRKFYALEPSRRFRYSTIGLLFVNVSVGGTLTHFAAPPVLMVAEPWGWTTSDMLGNFGWKAAVGILASNFLYWFIFRHEFQALRNQFQIRSIKEQILSRYLERETIERELDNIISEIRAKRRFDDELEALVGEFCGEVQNRLEYQFCERIAGTNIEHDAAMEAFRQRFDEIHLFRMQRDMPQLLPESRRASFVDPHSDEREDPVPLWVTAVHVGFMVWTIANAHHPVLFIPGLLFFLGFAAVTLDYQNTIDLKPPLLVGFFLGGLVIHGGVQGWWLEPVLGNLSETPLILISTGLTAFNDNAAITYLSTLVPGFTDELKYAVVAGAVAGGGLTVIANAPNPAGQMLLKKHFLHGVSPVSLLAAALAPTAIMLTIFWMFA
jgi:hypothetical protein